MLLRVEKGHQTMDRETARALFEVRDRLVAEAKANGSYVEPKKAPKITPENQE